jgi:hypothetical protein
MRRCAAWQATTPWHCATHYHTADLLHPRKTTAEPSKGRQETTPRPHKDNAVTPGRRGQSPPSPSVLCCHHHYPRHHLRHCITMSSTVGGRGDEAPPRRLLCAQRPPVSRTLEPMYGRRPHGRPLHCHPQSRSSTDTGHAMMPRQMQDSPGRPSTAQRCTPCLYT